MSPVSRGRKPKKSKKRGRTQRVQVRRSPPVDVTGLGVADVAQMLQQRTRPDWFEPAIKSVLDGAGALEAARGPRELEQATAELLGAEQYAAVQESRGGFWFEWWFEELVAAAAAQVVEDARTGTPAFLLLHGLAAVGTPALAAEASRRVRELPVTGLPEWLDDLSALAATGEVFRMRDGYGTRFAVLAGFTYGDDRSVFLFDIDASGFIRLAGAGVFDDVDQAAAAWLADVGDAAGATAPEPVTDGQQLSCLVHCATGDDMGVFGDESRVVMDNWFRAQRRRHDLAEAMRRRRMPLRADESLYDDIDVAPMVEEFTSWYTGRHGAAPDGEALAAVAEEWTEGSLPETWYSVSPERVRHHRQLISDWMSDDPISLEARSLLPDWVTWLGERAGLPAHLRERVDAAVR